MARQLKWKVSTEEFVKELDKQLSKKNKVASLQDKASLLESAAQVNINRWSDNDLLELSTILDRSAYLVVRTEVMNLKKIDARERASKLQKIRFEFLADRQRNLYNLLIKMNPSLETSDALKPAHQAFVKLLEYPAHLLNPKHLNLIIALRRMERSLKGHETLKGIKKDKVKVKIETPQRVWELYERSRLIKELSESDEISTAELRLLWEGLYLNLVF